MLEEITDRGEESPRAVDDRVVQTRTLYKLPRLPYAINALEPHMSREALEHHYGEHHLGYVENLNALAAASSLKDMSLEQLVRNASGALYEAAARSWNHEFYWRCMAPRFRTEATGVLAVAIDRQFGSFYAFKEQFRQQAMKKFGSGWTWLVRTNEGKLAVQNTEDADNPLRTGRQPLLVCDVSAHAYCIDHRNDRAKYIDVFWKVANWEFAAGNYLP